jgi:hypothetical protein
MEGAVTAVWGVKETTDNLRNIRSHGGLYEDVFLKNKKFNTPANREKSPYIL